MSDGTFTITIADTITGEDREIAQQAAEFARDSIVVRDLIWHETSDTSRDAALEAFHADEALEFFQVALDVARTSQISRTGWVSADITVTSVDDGSFLMDVCESYSQVFLVDSAGTSSQFGMQHFQLVQYTIVPLSEGLRISGYRSPGESYHWGCRLSPR